MANLFEDLIPAEKPNRFADLIPANNLFEDLIPSEATPELQPFPEAPPEALEIAGTGRIAKTVEEALKIFEKFRTSVTEGSDTDDMGELGCLAGVKQFPNRVKCATLAWHTMKSALVGEGKVTTE